MAKLQCRHCLLHGIGNGNRPFSLCVREQNHEFLATVTHQQICRAPQTLPHGSGNPLQTFIPFKVAVGVVETI